MHIDFWFLVVLLTAGAVFAAYAAQRARQQRSSDLAAFATSRGWAFRPADPALAKAWTGPPFVAGGRVTNVLDGTIDGRGFTAFDYAWTEGSGDDQTTVHRLVAAIRLPAALPLLWVLPETLQNRLTNPLGAHDITFESAEFNQRFMVTADNDRYAYSVMQPLMMAYLMDTPAGANPIRIEGNHALSWLDGELDAGRAEALLGELSGFVERIPSFVYDQHVAAAAASGYAGSVSGLRPEATGADLMRTGFVLVWGVIWLGISVPMTLLWYFGSASSAGAGGPVWLHWGWLFPAAFVLIGVLVVGSQLLKLVRGWIAISQNTRQRRAAD